MGPEEEKEVKEILYLVHEIAYESFGKSKEQLQRILKKIRVMTRHYGKVAVRGA